MGQEDIDIRMSYELYYSRKTQQKKSITTIFHFLNFIPAEILLMTENFISAEKFMGASNSL